MQTRWFGSRKGMSNLTEYVVLVSVVAGAAIVMQPFLRVRLQGAARSASTNYDAAMAAAGVAPGNFEPVRTVTSNSAVSMVMGNATTGNVTMDSNSTVGQNK